MKYSQYQEDIFEFVEYGYGNALVSAVAGSGKTFTAVEMLKFIPSTKRVLFLAFNNSIVEVLKNKIDRKNTFIKTLHSFGFSIITKNYPDVNVDDNKYLNKLKSILTEKELTIKLLDKKYIKNIVKLCDLGRLFLIKKSEDLLFLSKKYTIQPKSDEIELAFELIQWAKDSIDETNLIDYVDMIYLPIILSLKTFKYDFIIIDEAQDLSVSHMKLFLSAFKQGGRFIAFGDDKQLINGFAGSDADSFNKLMKLPNTISLPLSISYRCPKKVVNLAKTLVPQIEYANNAIDGDITYNGNIDDIKDDNDMVICRNSLPLIKLYLTLINNGIKCYIKGNDIGINLIELIEYTNSDSSLIDLDDELDEMLKNFINNLTIEGVDIENSQEYSDLLDKITVIKLLKNDEKLNTKEDLKNKIEIIFNGENKGVCLSTIHKAKGLEANNVFILNSYLTPSKCAKQDWEKDQEKNLEYVSYTRAKEKLIFITI